MKEHILSMHLVAWGRWTNVNIILIAKDRLQEKFKHRTVVGYGAITNHFGSTIPYRKMMWGGNNSWRTCCLLPYIHAYLYCR